MMLHVLDGCDALRFLLTQGMMWKAATMQWRWAATTVHTRACEWRRAGGSCRTPPRRWGRDRISLKRMALKRQRQPERQMHRAPTSAPSGMASSGIKPSRRPHAPLKHAQRQQASNRLVRRLHPQAHGVIGASRAVSCADTPQTCAQRQQSVKAISCAVATSARPATSRHQSQMRARPPQAHGDGGASEPSRRPHDHQRNTDLHNEV
jgi:hypothetical protein